MAEISVAQSAILHLFDLRNEIIVTKLSPPLPTIQVQYKLYDDVTNSLYE